MSWWQIAIGVVIFVVAPVAELYIYSADLFWHGPKTDRRNWTPPR